MLHIWALVWVFSRTCPFGRSAWRCPEDDVCVSVCNTLPPMELNLCGAPSGLAYKNQGVLHCIKKRHNNDLIFLIKTFFICLFLERGEGREKERERNINVWLPLACPPLGAPPTGDPVQNPGMCPDWESNQQSLGLQASAQSTDPHQPGPMICFNLQGQPCFWFSDCLN